MAKPDYKKVISDLEKLINEDIHLLMEIQDIVEEGKHIEQYLKEQLEVLHKEYKANPISIMFLTSNDPAITNTLQKIIEKTLLLHLAAGYFYGKEEQQASNKYLGIRECPMRLFDPEDIVKKLNKIHYNKKKVEYAGKKVNLDGLENKFNPIAKYLKEKNSTIIKRSLSEGNSFFKMMYDYGGPYKEKVNNLLGSIRRLGYITGRIYGIEKEATRKFCS